MKRNFGVEEGDNDAAIIERVEAGTSGWDEATRATVPYLRYLLSIDPGDPTVVVMDPMERRAGIFDSLRASYWAAAWLLQKIPMTSTSPAP